MMTIKVKLGGGAGGRVAPESRIRGDTLLCSIMEELHPTHLQDLASGRLAMRNVTRVQLRKLQEEMWQEKGDRIDRLSFLACQPTDGTN